MFASTDAKLPPRRYSRIIQEMLVVFADPVEKLTLLHRSLAQYRRIPSIYRLFPNWKEIALYKMVLAEIGKIRPESRRQALELVRRGIITSPRPLLWRLYRLRHVIISLVALLFIGGLSLAAAALYDFIQPGPPKIPVFWGASAEGLIADELRLPARQALKEPDGLPGTWFGRLDGLSAALPRPEGRLSAETDKSLPTDMVLSARTTASDPLSAALHPTGNPESAVPATQKENLAEMPVVVMPAYLHGPIWLVEKTGTNELYSNRLNIIATHTIDNVPRKYLLIPRSAAPDDNAVQPTQEVRGIVFHTSESDLLPFNPQMNRSIIDNSQRLIHFLKRNKSYHYFIDRFGRVYRIVREEHAAFHAGQAIWSDAENYYLNLNHAFIGICFEGRDFENLTDLADVSPGEAARIVSMAASSINEAQIVSGKELTDWLRVKYHIHERNCVPHGLVSINQRTKLIGYHLDLSYDFPFLRFGLNDKYQNLLPSVVDFGFTYDRFFENIFQGKPWPGARRSVLLLHRLAREKQISLEAYQKKLWDRFEAYYALEKGLKDGAQDF